MGKRYRARDQGYPPRRRWLLCLAFGCVAVLWAGASLAQANYEGGSLSGRTAIMGGTGVVTGADGATPLQNPAVLLAIDGTSIAFSTFFFEFAHRKVSLPGERQRTIEGAGPGESSLTIVPGALCVFAQWPPDSYAQVGRHEFSFCGGEPERWKLDDVSTFAGNLEIAGGRFQNRAALLEYRRRAYTVAWAFSLSEKFQIGFTQVITSIRLEDASSIATLFERDGFARETVSTFVRSGVANSTSMVAGLTYSPSERWRIGASVQTPALHLFGSYTGQQATQSPDGSQSVIFQEDGDLQIQYPARLALGIAGLFTDWLFEINGFFHAYREDFARADFDRIEVRVDGGTATVNPQLATIRQQVRPVVNVGAGAEAYFSPDLSILGGVVTDFTGLPKFGPSVASQTLFRSRLNAVHASLGLSTHGKEGDLLFGVRGTYAKGQVLALSAEAADAALVPLDQTAWSVAFIISGRIDLVHLVDAVRGVQESVLDASAPARVGGVF